MDPVRAAEQSFQTHVQLSLTVTVSETSYNKRMGNKVTGQWENATFDATHCSGVGDSAC